MIRAALPGSLLAYGVVAVFVGRWWISGLCAPVIAVLLWMRHPRARFSAYVFFTVIALRGLIRGPWALVVFAAAAILVLQTPAARRAWPRIRSDRMARP